MERSLDGYQMITREMALRKGLDGRTGSGRAMAQNDGPLWVQDDCFDLLFVQIETGKASELVCS
jgi:hypothetical protein